MTWQTIETAPRNGKEFLAWSEDGGIIICVWWDGLDAFVDHQEFLARKPTHWHPLPEPPK